MTTIEQSISKLMVDNVLTVNPDMKIEDALRLLDEKGIRRAPVVDKDGVLLGMFSSGDLVHKLVPLFVNEGIIPSLEFFHGGGPVVAKRLKQIYPDAVEQHMDKHFITINPKTSTLEALRLLGKHGSPLPVVESHSNILLGLISDQSVIEALLKMEDEDECDE